MKFLKKIFGKDNSKNPALKSNKTNNKTSDIQDRLRKALEILNKYKRTAYLPVTIITESQFSSDNKIGGLPYLRNNNDWPVCPNCKTNMQLFLQLNLEQLPINQNSGLLQLFYCTSYEPHCESELEAFFPFSKATLCRIIEIKNAPVEIVPVIDGVFPEKRIIEWESVDDYPHSEEYELLGIDLEIDDDLIELMDEKELGVTISQDKLFGWPYWVQSVEYPFDRKTKSKMEMLFQFDSEDNLPYMFGDSGIGHLTQSQHNKTELSFGWACY